VRAEGRTCAIRPYDGIEVVGVGEVDFGMTAQEVEAVLGPGRPMRRWHGDAPGWPYELHYGDDSLLISVRFDFDKEGHCAFIEFVSPRTSPPLLEGHPLAGPTLRQAAEVVLGLGYEPDEGAMEDLAGGRLGQATSGSDSVDFPAIGLTLWTSLSMEGDECGELGEHVLDSVALWRSGYWPDYP
jgi:hypothetical protein